jgi:hypothetical protein
MKAIVTKNLNEKLDIKVFTKLMEYVDVTDSDELEELRCITGVASEINSNIMELDVISDKDGCDTVFANNPGNENVKPQGAVCYRFGNATSAMNASKIPLYGHSITGGQAYNLLHAYVIKDGDIYTSKEKKPYSGKFQEEEKLDVTLPVNFIRIHQIKTCQFDNDFALFTVSETQEGGYFLTIRYGSEKYDRMIPVAWGKGIFAFQGTKKEDLCAHQVSAVDGEIYYTYMYLNDEKLHRYKVTLSDSTEQPLEIAQVKGQVFMLSSAYKLYRLDVTGENCNAVYIQGYAQVSGISMQRDTKYVHISMLNDSNQLMHSYLSLDASEGDMVMMFPLDTSVSVVAMSNYETTATIYYFSTQKSKLVRMSYDVDGDNWNDLDIDIPDENQVMRLPCYSTEITLMDKEYHQPKAGVKVKVWTEQRSCLQTVDGIKVCDESHQLILTTDARGKITVAQYTDKIDVPVVYASLPTEMMAEDEVLAIQQFETVSEKMEQLKSDDLMNARMTDSMSGDMGYLIPDSKRTQANVDAIVQSVHQVMNLKKGMLNASNPNPYARGVYRIKKDEVGTLKTLRLGESMPAWRLTVNGDKLEYADMSNEEFMEYRNAVCGDDKWISDEKFKSIFSKIGDFFRSVKKKIVQVVELVVKGVETVVTFVLDGVKMIYNFVTNTVGEILDFVETIFAVVAVFFVSVFAWLASLFMWDDLKLTQRLLNGLLEGLINSAPSGVDKLRKLAGDFIKDVDGKLDEKIDEICSKISPDKSVYEYVEDNTPESPEYEEANSNNQFLDKFIAVQRTEKYCLSMMEESSGTYTEIEQVLEKFTSDVTVSDGWKALEPYIQDVFSSESNIATKLVVSLFQIAKSCVHAILEGLDEVVNALCNVTGAILSQFWTQITTNMNINVPFFSKLYKLITGDDLTLLNLITFIGGVPTLLVYKMTGRSLPYSNASDVERIIEELKNDFVWMYDEDCRNGYKESKTASFILSIAAGTFGTAYYAMAAEDVWSERTRSKNIFCELLSSGMFVTEFVWVACCFPLIHKSKLKWYDRFMWIFFAVGEVINGIFIGWKASKKDASYVDKICNFTTTIYGIIHLGFAIGILCVNYEEYLSYIPEIIGALTETPKVLIDLLAKKKAIICGVLSGINGLAGLAVFTCSIAGACNSDEKPVSLLME